MELTINGERKRVETGATVADDPVVRQWQLSRAFDSVLKKARSKRADRN